MSERLRPTQVTGPLAFHGEGPVWDAPAGVIRWVDMLAGDVLSMRPGSDPAATVDAEAVTRLHVGRVAAALRPRRSGGLVVAVERGFVLLDADGMPAGAEVPAFDDPAVRMNDGGCDAQGRFYCGSMAYDVTPGTGSLFRFDPDGSVSTVLEGVTISNGFAVTPDGATAYYVDTPTQRIDAFDLDTERGLLTGRRTVATVEEGAGSPDGLCLDDEGGIWVALYGGGAVRRYSTDGRLDEVVELPVSRPTACAFGGAGLDELFVTTSREGLPARGEPGDEPAAGSLFSVRPGVRGLPVHAFAG